MAGSRYKREDIERHIHFSLHGAIGETRAMASSSFKKKGFGFKQRLIKHGVKAKSWLNDGKVLVQSRKNRFTNKFSMHGAMAVSACKY